MREAPIVLVCASLFHYPNAGRRLRDPASPCVRARWTTTGIYQRCALTVLVRAIDACVPRSHANVCPHALMIHD
jgi:hypothetical protein